MQVSRFVLGVKSRVQGAKLGKANGFPAGASYNIASSCTLVKHILNGCFVKCEPGT